MPREHLSSMTNRFNGQHTIFPVSETDEAVMLKPKPAFDTRTTAAWLQPDRDTDHELHPGYLTARNSTLKPLQAAMQANCSADAQRTMQASAAGIPAAMANGLPSLAVMNLNSNANMPGQNDTFQ